MYGWSVYILIPVVKKILPKYQQYITQVHILILQDPFTMINDQLQD